MAAPAPPYEFPKVSKADGLVEGYLEEAHGYDIPQETLDNEVAYLLKELKSKPTFNPNLKFDPEKHILFSDEDFDNLKRFTLDDLKISKTQLKPFSNFGAAFPFPLITREAADMMKWEAFQPHILKDYARLPNLSKGATGLDFHVGGHARDDAPFTWAFFTSKKLSEIVSKIAGFNATHLYNAELAHVNCSLASVDPNIAQVDDETLLAQYAKQNEGSGTEIPSTLGLHYDSSPLALVVMLDYADNAIGGETGIITGDEKVFRVPDPKVGYGTLLQGRIVRHVATKPLTNSNRISIVTGFSPSDPDVLDNCALTSTKPSVLPRALFNRFYADWMEFKFKKLEDKLKFHREEAMKDYYDGKYYDQAKYIKVMKDMEKYIQSIYSEMELVSNNPYPPPHFNMPYNELPDYE